MRHRDEIHDPVLCKEQSSIVLGIGLYLESTIKIFSESNNKKKFFHFLLDLGLILRWTKTPLPRPAPMRPEPAVLLPVLIAASLAALLLAPALAEPSASATASANSTDCRIDDIDLDHLRLIDRVGSSSRSLSPARYSSLPRCACPSLAPRLALTRTALCFSLVMEDVEERKPHSQTEMDCLRRNP